MLLSSVKNNCVVFHVVPRFSVEQNDENSKIIIANNKRTFRRNSSYEFNSIDTAADVSKLLIWKFELFSVAVQQLTFSFEKKVKNTHTKREKKKEINNKKHKKENMNRIWFLSLLICAIQVKTQTVLQSKF